MLLGPAGMQKLMRMVMCLCVSMRTADTPVRDNVVDDDGDAEDDDEDKRNTTLNSLGIHLDLC